MVAASDFDTSKTLGTTRPLTSPMPISSPALRRIRSTRFSSASSALIWSGLSGSTQSEVGGPNDDGAQARIDAADLDAVDVVDAVARREQRTGGAAGEIGERQRDGGGTAADPGDRLISAILDGAVRRLDGGHDTGPCVDEPDTHVGRGAGDGHQAALDRERTDAGEDVAACGGRVDRAGLRINLSEEIVHVDVFLG
jgi:hypothetical protein